MHPNVPEPVNMTGYGRWETVKAHSRRFINSRLVPFIVALLAPEWILLFSQVQCAVATRIAKKHGLSRSQVFFIIMGGFHLFERNVDIINNSTTFLTTEAANEVEFTTSRLLATDDTEIPRHPLDRFDVLDLLYAGKLEMPRPGEIQDKSKNDWIAKTTVVVQTAWFIAQCIGRKAQRLPLAELEVITLAYTLVNLMIYINWWDKPYQVAEPVRYYGELPERDHKHPMSKEIPKLPVITRMLLYLVCIQDEFTDLRRLKRTPTFYTGATSYGDEQFASMRGLWILFVVGTAFGGIHLLAWASFFPTPLERLLWRISAITLTVGPFLTPTLSIIFLALMNCFNTSSILRIIVSTISPIVYLISRGISMTVALTTLRNLPPEAYRNLEWSNFLPHT
ncbi:SubName: Full=Uncharacterized protein {ECO:0000313/EMBL:CCA69324.1} [Serendipita indica DSM 11827]|nr:SubName: Full=Uncharacterized protein {ECO:0000313/EMBL:CCA69324.1} [Serendipita indica DSM 11827]